MPSPGINALHYIRYRIGLDRARTQTTEAERALMAEVAARPDEQVSPAALKYMNRLSDFLFVGARFANDCGKADVLWVPGQNR